MRGQANATGKVLPMPPLRRTFPLALGFLALLALPALPALPAAAGTIHGTGTASAITVYKDSGESFEGGLYRHNRACLDCFINVTFISADMAVIQNGVSYPIEPGTYQFREYQGLFSYTSRGLGRIDVRFEGAGWVHEV